MFSNFSLSSSSYSSMNNYFKYFFPICLSSYSSMNNYFKYVFQFFSVFFFLIFHEQLFFSNFLSVFFLFFHEQLFQVCFPMFLSVIMHVYPRLCNCFVELNSKFTFIPFTYFPILILSLLALLTTFLEYFVSLECI